MHCVVLALVLCSTVTVKPSGGTEAARCHMCRRVLFEPYCMMKRSAHIVHRKTSCGPHKGTYIPAKYTYSSFYAKPTGIWRVELKSGNRFSYPSSSTAVSNEHLLLLRFKYPSQGLRVKVHLTQNIRVHNLTTTPIVTAYRSYCVVFSTSTGPSINSVTAFRGGDGG